MLADVIESGVVPVVRLTEIFRQAAESRIITNAHRINRGQMPDCRPTSRRATSISSAAPSRRRGQRSCWQVVAERIPARFGLDPIRDVQVLCPMNRGRLGARTLNLELQQLLNPPGEAQWSSASAGRSAPGDKVMQVENDYDKDVFNGDIGLVDAGRCRRRARSWSASTRGEVTYPLGELDELVLAYATTVHKAQGSEYPAVVIPLDDPALPDAAAQPALHRR